MMLLYSRNQSRSMHPCDSAPRHGAMPSPDASFKGERRTSMADVDVKNSSQERSVSRRSGEEVSDQGIWEPSWWRSPSDFFTDPFSVMRRFREEMDRLFDAISVEVAPGL